MRWSTLGTETAGGLETIAEPAPQPPRPTAHRARLAPYVEPHLARRRAGVPHPVHDFLFTYYSFSPAKLLDWQPGWPASGSLGAADPAARPVDSTLELLRATAGRPATFSCFGLHEWAMVHRADRTRHPRPLRLGAAATDAVVESHSHRVLALRRLPLLHAVRGSAQPSSGPDPTTDRRTSSRAACTRRWISTSTRSGCGRCSAPTWSPTASSSPGTSAIVDMRAAPYDLSGHVPRPRRRARGRRSRSRRRTGSRSTPRTSAASRRRAAPLRDRLTDGLRAAAPRGRGQRVTVTLRDATPDDAEAVARIYVESWNAGFAHSCRLGA